MMGGWKTWAAAICLCLIGLAMIWTGIQAKELQKELFFMGLQAISFAFALVGIGSKVERYGKASVQAAAKQAEQPAVNG